MSTTLEATAAPSAWSRLTQSDAAIGLVVAAHFLYLAAMFGPAISTPDANGYLAQARLIAREGRTDIVVESPVQYVGDHWMAVAPGRYFGQYPPGLPAVLAVVFRTLGAYATLWVIPVMGSLALLGLYLVARDWVGRPWALLAAALMAVNPVSNLHALGADSHTAVCFFFIWALYGLTRWENGRSPAWAAFTGFCLGMIPTIRYPETLYLVAIALYVVLSPPRDARWLRSLLAAALAASLPIGALAARNQYAFGAFWRTGYSISGEQTGFGPGYFAMHFVPYLILLLIQGVALSYVLGVLGLIELCRRPDTRRKGRLLVGLIVPITLLYMAYYWHADFHSMRFLLPTFALYTIAAVWWLKLRAEEDPARARKWTRILVVVTLLWGLPYSTVALARLKRENMDLDRVSRVIAQHVPRGDVVVAQAGLEQHLDFLGDWRLAPEEAFDRPNHRRPPLGPNNAGGPPGPGRNRRPPPENDADPAEATQTFRSELARWAGEGRPVYWLTSEESLARVRGRVDAADRFEKLAEIEVRGRPGPPPGPPRDREPAKGWRPRWGGPPPPPPGGPEGRGGPPGGPARFEPPTDGKFVLVRWTIQPA